jgi:hypothetical protein
MARTPDIRTRAILEQWACRISVTFVEPNLTRQDIVNLLSAGGVTCGIGDWRPEKGKGNFGQYRVASITDPEFVSIRDAGGREQQIEAMEDAEPFDSDSRELLEWAIGEIALRGRKAS